MSNDKLDKIQDKIEKLLRLQQSAEKIGSLEEAALAAANANKLMAKYNLEVSMDQALDQEEKVLWELLSMNELHGWNKTEAGWMRQLYHHIARYNFCKIIYCKWVEYIRDDDDLYTGKSRLHEELKLFGEKTNMKMVMFMASQLVERLKAAHKISWKVYHGHEKKNAYKRGYLAGGVQGIASKLREQNEANKVEYTGLSELIVVKDAKVNDKIAEIYPSLGQTRSRGLSAQDGRSQGYSDGRKMNIRGGVTGGNKQLGS